NRPPPRYPDGWHSSYEPPVRGHRQDSRIIYGGSQHGLVLLPAVVAFLPLFRLSTGIILVILLFLPTRRRFGRGGHSLEFPHPRFNLVYEANILVILHHLGCGGVVGPLQRTGTQIYLLQVAGLHPRHAHRNREREERHAERHSKPQLPN